VNTNTDVLRRQERIFCRAGNRYVHYRIALSDNTLVIRSVRLVHETHAKYKKCSWSNTDAYVRFQGILNDTLQVFCGVRLEHATHAKIWNAFIYDCAYVKFSVGYSQRHPSSILWWWSTQEHQTHVKYETYMYSWSNTYANVKYWGPIPKIVCPQTAFKPPSVTHFLIHLDSWQCSNPSTVLNDFFASPRTHESAVKNHQAAISCKKCTQCIILSETFN